MMDSSTKSSSSADPPSGHVTPPSEPDNPGAENNFYSSERVSFACQRCLQPLIIDPSFNSMNEHTLAELSLPISPCPEVDLEARMHQVDKYVPPFKLALAAKGGQGGHDGFTLVGESGKTNYGVISHGLRVQAELYDMLSNQALIDHPLCEECTDTLLETMDQQLKCAEDEAQLYQRYLQALEQEEDDGKNVKILHDQLDDLIKEEKRLNETLAELTVEETSAEEELERQIKDRKTLEKQEKKYWKEYSKHKRELLLAEDEFRTLDIQNKYIQSQMEKLKRTNVFSATFHIWHTGHFATINGFRLGRLPSVPVEWSEINAAWGQTALLLASLAKIVGPDPFQKFQLVPYGSFSYIKVLADDKVLPLYGSGGFRMIFDTKFDLAMVAFLDCLQQFAAEVQKHGSFSLPYDMEKGKIRDNNTGHWYPIKLQFNSEDSWTKACRYMLTNLKWGLAFVGMKFLKQNSDDHVESDKQPQ